MVGRSLVIYSADGGGSEQNRALVTRSFFFRSSRHEPEIAAPSPPLTGTSGPVVQQLGFIVKYVSRIMNP